MDVEKDKRVSVKVGNTFPAGEKGALSPYRRV